VVLYSSPRLSHCAFQVVLELLVKLFTCPPACLKCLSFCRLDCFFLDRFNPKSGPSCVNATLGSTFPPSPPIKGQSAPFFPPLFQIRLAFLGNGPVLCAKPIFATSFAFTPLVFYAANLYLVVTWPPTTLGMFKPPPLSPRPAT